VLAFAADETPETTANFKQYVADGFYNGTVFHRVAPGFVIQGGGYAPGLARKIGGAAVANEATTLRPNARGTIALLNESDAALQVTGFAINLDDNAEFDAPDADPPRAVIGTVVDGLDVCAELAALPTAARDGFADLPADDVLIQSATREAVAADAPPRVRIATTGGAFVVELAAEALPASVATFLALVDEGYYVDTLVHAAVAGQRIETGLYIRGLAAKATRDPIASEAAQGLPNVRGTVGMARTDDADSATSQFYINLADNTALDATLTDPGYTVFGAVLEGMDVVDVIAAVAVAAMNGMDDVPVEDVLILAATIEQQPDQVSAAWDQWLAGAEYNLRNGGRTVLITLLSRLLGAG
jgi:peptidyl-prolyl cis-trans isomerase A (cyclophilin A)